MTLGEKIQILRKQRGMSQEQLAAKILVTRQAISKWELCESLPDVDNIVQLSEIFGVTTDYLLKNGEVTTRIITQSATNPTPTTTANTSIVQPDTKTAGTTSSFVGCILKSPMATGIIGMVFVGLNMLRRSHENALFPLAGVAIILGMMIVFLPQLKLLRLSDTGIRVGKFMTDVGIIAIIASGIFFRVSQARTILVYASIVAWVGLAVVGVYIANAIYINIKQRSLTI
ncbi:MAG: helix-turn-helix domain-containing protein [Defluviitaleaceae bacterium]|nr:helix-turn-helix domain-containing protein [Defluviitaleaceae bacterium]